MNIRSGGLHVIVDKGNWLDIGRSATEMNGQCATEVPGLWARYSYAWRYGGETDRIHLTLLAAGDSRDVE